MVRVVSVLGWAGVLLTAAGCRHNCGDRGLFSSAGRASGVEVCSDPIGPGVPVSGGGLPAGSNGLLVPGSRDLGPTEQLPPPTGVTIPPQVVPLAPREPAPGGQDFGTLPAPTRPGVPVKGGN